VIQREDPQPGQVWRSRVKGEEARTVIVTRIAHTHVRTQTLTTHHGRPPARTTRTGVLRTIWHRTFVYDREATPEEMAKVQ
jgi:hypothetical protein